MDWWMTGSYLFYFFGYFDFKKSLIQDLEISQYTCSVVPPTKCFVNGSKLSLTNLSEIQKLIMGAIFVSL